MTKYCNLVSPSSHNGPRHDESDGSWVGDAVSRHGTTIRDGRSICLSHESFRWTDWAAAPCDTGIAQRQHITNVMRPLLGRPIDRAHTPAPDHRLCARHRQSGSLVWFWGSEWANCRDIHPGFVVIAEYTGARARVCLGSIGAEIEPRTRQRTGDTTRTARMDGPDGPPRCPEHGAVRDADRPYAGFSTSHLRHSATRLHRHRTRHRARPAEQRSRRFPRGDRTAPQAVR